MTSTEAVVIGTQLRRLFPTARSCDLDAAMMALAPFRMETARELIVRTQRLGLRLLPSAELLMSVAADIEGR